MRVPLQHARQIYRRHVRFKSREIKRFTDHYINRGTHTAAHLMEDQGCAQRIVDMTRHLVGQAVLAVEKYRHDAGLCAPD